MNPAKKRLREEIAKLLKHYYLFMEQSSLAADSKISHTAVKGAINSANEFNEKITDQILNTLTSHIRSLIPEKRIVTKEATYKGYDRDNPKHRYVTGIDVGYNQCIEDILTAIEEKMG